MGCACPFNNALIKHPCAGPSPGFAERDAGDAVGGRLDLALLAGFLPRSVGRLFRVKINFLGIDDRSLRLVCAVHHGVQFVFGC